MRTLAQDTKHILHFYSKSCSSLFTLFSRCPTFLYTIWFQCMWCQADVRSLLFAHILTFWQNCHYSAPLSHSSFKSVCVFHSPPSSQSKGSAVMQSSRKHEKLNVNEQALKRRSGQKSNVFNWPKQLWRLKTVSLVLHWSCKVKLANTCALCDNSCKLHNDNSWLYITITSKATLSS